MSAERQRRLAILDGWWKSNMGRVIDGEINKHPIMLSMFDYDEAMSYLKAEVQKRWGLSMSTTLDYARIVFVGNEKQLKSELKKRQSSSSDER